MTGQSEVVASVEPERDVLYFLAQVQRPLGERSRLIELPCLAEVFASMDGDQPEPALIGDRGGHCLGLPQASHHFLKLAERV